MAGTNIATPIDAAPPVRVEHEPIAIVDLDDAVSAPEVGRPVGAVRTGRFPQLVFTSQPNMQAAAGQALFDPWEVPANGYLRISGAITGVAARWQVSVDDGGTFIDLNKGVNLTLGAWDEEVVHLAQGRRVTLGVNVNTTVAALDVFFVADD